MLMLFFVTIKLLYFQFIMVYFFTTCKEIAVDRKLMSLTHFPWVMCIYSCRGISGLLLPEYQEFYCPRTDAYINFLTLYSIHHTRPWKPHAGEARRHWGELPHTLMLFTNPNSCGAPSMQSFIRKEEPGKELSVNYMPGCIN